MKKRGLIGISLLIAILLATLCIAPLTAFAIDSPPVAVVDAVPATIEGNTIGGAYVSLDGSASYDPDGDPIVFWWTGSDGVTFDDENSPTPTAFCPLGPSTIELEVTDPAGNADFHTVMTEVVDTTPPDVTVSHLMNKSGKKPLPFYMASATDIVWESPQIFIEDTGTGTVFGPFSSGVTFQYIVAPGATPNLKPAHIPNVAWVIKAQGPGQASAVDGSGNVVAMLFK